MKLKTKLVAGCVAVTVVGLASSTPIVNLSSPILAVGSTDQNILTHGISTVNGAQNFKVRLTTDGPASVTVQEAAYAAGGQNGWHGHPGMVALVLISGSIEWYDSECNKSVYNAGDSWTEGSEKHAFRVVGTVSAHFIATFITAKGAALRIDRGPPPCAIALGLNL